MTAAAKPAIAGALPFAERHFTVNEIAEMWNVSARTVRRTFEKEQGVLALGDGNRVTLRIPQSVLERVYRRQCVGAL